MRCVLVDSRRSSVKAKLCSVPEVCVRREYLGTPALEDVDLGRQITNDIARPRLYIQDGRLEIAVDCIFDDASWRMSYGTLKTIPAIVTDTTVTILKTHRFDTVGEYGSCSWTLNATVYHVSIEAGYYRVQAADSSFDGLFLRGN